MNTGTGCTGQTAWLVTCATAGEAPGTNPNFLRISALVSHDSGNTIASLVTDDDWDGTVDPATVRGVTATGRRHRADIRVHASTSATRTPPQTRV